jgi:hypothetical protein
VAPKGIPSEAVILFQEDHRGHLPGLRMRLQETGIGILDEVPRGEASRDALNDRLVVALAGDGTLLTLSHYMQSGTILLVHARGEGSAGHFAVGHLDNLSDVLNEGAFTVRDVPRLQAVIKRASAAPDTVVDLAFNDYYLGNLEPGRLSKYRVNGERQLSSGLIISTPQGLTGWAANVHPLRELSMPDIEKRMGADKFVYVSRETFRDTDYYHEYGFTNALDVEYLSDHGCVQPDGFDQWNVKRHDVVRFTYGAPLRFVGPVQDGSQ